MSGLAACDADYAPSFIYFRAVGDFVTRCWPTKPKASQKLDFGPTLGSALFLEVTASIREWSAGSIPEQRSVMYLPEKRLAPLVLRKPLLVRFCVEVLVLFIVFSIFCITSFGGCFRSQNQETTLARLQCTQVFPITLKQSSSRKQFRITSPFLDWKYDSNKEVKRKTGKGKPCNRFNFQ